MKEAVFILIVVIVLIAISAYRYRKRIADVMAVGRMIRDAKRAAEGGQSLGSERPGKQLVRCSRCGVWVPEGKSAGSRNGPAYCSEECQKVPA